MAQNATQVNLRLSQRTLADYTYMDVTARSSWDAFSFLTSENSHASCSRHRLDGKKRPSHSRKFATAFVVSFSSGFTLLRYSSKIFQDKCDEIEVFLHKLSTRPDQPLPQPVFFLLRHRVCGHKAFRKRYCMR